MVVADLDHALGPQRDERQVLVRVPPAALVAARGAGALLLLGLYRPDGNLASVGVVGALPMEKRIELFAELQPLVTTFDQHPWNWGEHLAGQRTPRAAMASRWNADKDLSFIPLRPERVLEVRYDHMEGPRFRHTAQFVRWRPDREPRSCTYAQLEEPVSFDLAEILRGPAPRTEHG